MSSDRRQFWIIFVAAAISVGVPLTLLNRAPRHPARRLELSDAAQRAGLTFPEGTRLLGMAEVDGTLYAKFDFDRLKAESFILLNSELTHQTPTNVAHSVNDEGRLDWWHPSGVKVFRFWNFARIDGDGMEVLIDEADAQRATVYVHVFEI